MNDDELTAYVQEATRKAVYAAMRDFNITGRKRRATVKKTPEKQPVEFSKKLMLFASVMYAASWLIAVISWFKLMVLPEKLLEYSTYLYGVALAVYGGKAAYENKPKIEAVYDSNNYEE